MDSRAVLHSLKNASHILFPYMVGMYSCNDVDQSRAPAGSRLLRAPRGPRRGRARAARRHQLGPGGAQRARAARSSRRSSLPGPDGVPAELVAKRGEHAVGERILLAGAEAREERGGDRPGRHRLVDRILHGPPALARVLHPPADLLERGILRERAARQLDQPGAHDAALHPEVGDPRRGRARTDSCASARSPRRWPASSRTRCRCGPSSRSGPRRGRPCVRSRSRARACGRGARGAGRRPPRRPPSGSSRPGAPRCRRSSRRPCSAGRAA